MKKIYSLVAALAASAFTMTVNAQNELVVGDVKVGDMITLSDGSQWYVGANEIENGSFSMDPAKNNGNIVGWTVGTYAQMTTSNFTWVAEGGYDGGAYIKASGHTGAGGVNSIAKHWPLETNTKYYFSFYVKDQGANNQYSPVITLTDLESTAGGQNETNYLIGMSGNSADGALGFSTYGNGEWAQTACAFNSEEYKWLQCNARWLGSTHSYDGFFLAKLYDPETTSAEKVAEISLLAVLSQAESAQENDLADYPALAEELGDWIMNSGYADYTADSNTKEELQAAIDSVNNKLTAITASIESFRTFDTALVEAYALYDGTSYPGQDAFGTVIEELLDYQSNGYYSLDKDKSATEYVAVAQKELTDAVKAYRFSQEASEESPADYTFFIDNPKFAAKGSWYIGQTGGDQRLHSGLTDNTGNAMTAWNAWRSDLSDETRSVSISQNISGLPNGKYTVTADMLTQDGCITDQHVFANASASSAVSPVMTQTGWDPYVWETLTTGTVIVVDGQLTIGAIGHGINQTPSERGGTQTDNRCGWFCTSNFTLNYLGEASEEEYTAAIKAKVAEAQAIADTMHYAADKAALQAAIDTTKTADDASALNAAISVALASESDYASVIAGTYKTLQDSIATSESYTENAKKITQVVVDHMTAYLACDTASYNYSGAITTVLRYYLNSLVPTLLKAESTEISDATGKAALEGTIADVVKKLSRYIGNTTVLAAYVSDMENAIAVARKADIKYGDGEDVTEYITNASIDDANVTGWTVNNIDGDGTGAKSGQASDGVSGNYYIDTWNSTAGKARATIYQVIDVPNGTYRLSAEQRNSGGGYYLFASNAAPVLNADTALVLDPTATNVLSLANPVATPGKYVVNATADKDTLMTDTYGSIWMEAADKLMTKFGITGAVNADTESGVEAMSIYDQVIEANGGETTCPEGIDEADWTLFTTNNGIGRGWFYNSLEITVDNHTLCVGVTNDSIFTEGITDVDGNLAVQFTGTWISANNFKLTMVKAGDNDGWNPATGIETVEPTAGKSATVVAVFSAAGVRQNGLQKGINIVKYADGTAKKILVK